MDFIKQVLHVVGSFVQAMVDLFAQMIMALSGSMVDMTEAEAQTIATVFLGLVVLAWVARRTLWGKGMGAFKPMTVTLHTTKTPWQVLMSDLRSCVVTVIALTVLLVLVLAVMFGG